MKITDMQITPVAVPIKSLQLLKRNFMRSLLIEIFTDEGIVGIGESPFFWEGETCLLILRSLRSCLIGKDPRDINKRAKELYAFLELPQMHIQFANWAVSGIEMALWDILGKRANKPLCDVWGGTYRTRIEFVGEVEHQDLVAMKASAAAFVEDGYRTIYYRASSNLEDDIAALSMLRDCIQDVHIKFRIGANQMWSTGEAITAINQLENYGIEFVDQPVSIYNTDALKLVRNSVSVSIAGHESCRTMYDVMNVVKDDAVDYLYINGRMDLGYNGARISAGIAEAAGIQCVYHMYPGLGVAFAMDLQMIAATANCTLANEAFAYSKLEDDIISGGKIERQGPWYTVPNGSGIGVDLDKAKVQKYNEFYQKAASDYIF